MEGRLKLWISIFIFAFSINGYGMGRPEKGSSSGAFDFAWRTPITNQNKPWAQSLRTIFQFEPYFVGLEKSINGHHQDQESLGFLAGIGSGPNQLAKPILGPLRGYMRLNFINIRILKDRITSYSGIEAGFATRMTKKWGIFAGLGVDFPGLLFAPLNIDDKFIEKNKDRDGLNTTFALGITYLDSIN